MRERFGTTLGANSISEFAAKRIVVGSIRGDDDGNKVRIEDGPVS